ncbi:MFS transporter [Janibacter corallicola]|uniref:MFS transporter n=1 Tax=Janibacter corallicola TaxID=415212 RepID=UPI0008336DCA|nr:MFS transporter [Janibacter corallicola]
MTTTGTHTPAATESLESGRFRLITALYFTQYLGVGFLTIGLVAILRDGGTSLATLGLLQTIGIIWPIKVLWAPLVDRFGSTRFGHYRSWLVPLQLGLVLALLALTPFAPPSEHLGPVIAIATLFVLFSATQDIAADALAVRLLTSGERGLGNGIQVGGNYLGTVVGGGVAVIVHDQWGWVPAMILLAALTAVALVVVIAYREPAREVRVRRAGYRDLLTVFGQPGCRSWVLVVIPLYYIGAAVGYAIVSPALVDAGWSLTRIGVVSGAIASVPAVLSSLGAGALVSRWGRLRVLVLGGVVLALAILCLVPLALGSAPTGWTTIALCVFMAAYAMANVVVYTINMDYARADSAGTDFTMLSCIALAVSFVAAGVALAAAEYIGYVGVLGASVALVLLGTVLGARHQRRHAPAGGR